MEISKAKKIINFLADGVDPFTNKILPNNSPYQNSEMEEVLFLAFRGLELLEDRINKKKRRNPKKKIIASRTGAPWSFEEEKRLIERYKSNIEIIEIAKEFGRNPGAIRTRLKRLGKIK